MRSGVVSTAPHFKKLIMESKITKTNKQRE